MKTIIINNSIFCANRIEVCNKLNEVYNFLELLEDEYPNFDTWFFSKVINDLAFNRSIIIKEYKGKIVGVSIIKMSTEERKICTFRVADEFQNIGIGTALMFDSLKELNTLSPLITVSENRISQFIPILKKFSFNLYSINSDYYKYGVNEYSFNGPLEEKTHHNIWYKKMQNQFVINGL